MLNHVDGRGGQKLSFELLFLGSSPGDELHLTVDPSVGGDRSWSWSWSWLAMLLNPLHPFCLKPEASNYLDGLLGPTLICIKQKCPLGMHL